MKTYNLNPFKKRHKGCLSVKKSQGRYATSNLTFSSQCWGALWATHKIRNPIIVKPQELLARTGNTHHPTSPPHTANEMNLGWFFTDRDSTGSPPSISTGYQLPQRSVEQPPGNPFWFLAFTLCELWKLVFSWKEEENRCLRQTGYSPTDQTSQGLMLLSCFG